MKREDFLTTAAHAIMGPRDQDYGDARVNFGNIGNLWAVVFGHEVTPQQVALCLGLVKVARLLNTPNHEDSWVDIAGYAALGGEIATEGSNPFARE